MDLRGINRAWLYKDPKVSVLQANVKLGESIEHDYIRILKSQSYKQMSS